MKNLSWSVALSVAAFLVAGTLAHAQSSLNFIKLETQIPYRAMIKKLNAAVKAEKMLTVTRASASAGAKNRGLKIKGNIVVGVYRNDFAIRMLEASIDAGIEAPIRFYITEQENGNATLSYRSPSTIFSPYFNSAKPELRQVASELDVIFAAIAKRATGQ